MDSLFSCASVHKTKASKNTKSKRKPIKVVYISNPMKVKTSASKFRALVQELTGQDAGLPDSTKFSDTDHAPCGNQIMAPDAAKVAVDQALEEDPMGNSTSHVQHDSFDFSFDPFDEDAFMPQMIENVSGLQPSSSLLCESSSQVDMLRTLDAV